VKPHWLVIGSLAITGLMATSARAETQLRSWEFFDNQKRLEFETQEPVQPRAKLLSNPTRVVIDLPGTILRDPEQRETLGGIIQTIQVAQFNQETTRMVIELQKGYTLDPEQIEIRGQTPHKWSVKLPSPQRTEVANGSTVPQQAAVPTIDEPHFKETSSGFLLQLGEFGSQEIEVERSEDQKQISISLPEGKLPSNLPSVIPIQKYGVGYMVFRAGNANSPPEIQLHVHEDSPDWRAIETGNSGVLLRPKGGMEAVQTGLPTPSIPKAVTEAVQESSKTDQKASKSVVEKVALVNNQLLIRATGSIQATGNWDPNSGVYEVEIPNAKLADPVDGPELTRNSPVSQIRLVKSDDNKVLVQIQSAPGMKIDDQINQPSKETLALNLESTPNTASQPNPSQQSKRLNVPEPQRSQAQQPSRGDQQQEPLIVIAPGHGGKDPGAIGRGGLKEKDVVLSIALSVQDILQQNGVNVRTVRKRDRFVTLSTRAETANRVDADLFLSIHANAINMNRPDVNGTETYYYSSGSTLAQSIQRSIIRQTNMNNRGVKQGNLYVLRNSAMPSALVETGFVTGRQDARRLADPNFRKRMAKAIADGILKYVERYE